MVHPLVPAPGVLPASAVPPAPRLPDLASFLPPPGGGGDGEEPEALLAEIVLREPAVRREILREIDRRLSGEAPEAPGVAARLEGLRELLRGLEAGRPPGAVGEELETPPAPAGRVPEAGPALPIRPVPPPPGAASPELVERVLRAARLVRSRGLARLRLELEPPALGELRLDLALRRSALHATFRAGTPAAAEALRERLPELRRALEARGLVVAELSVAGAETPAERPLPRPDPGAAGALDLKA